MGLFVIFKFGIFFLILFNCLILRDFLDLKERPYYKTVLVKSIYLSYFRGFGSIFKKREKEFQIDRKKNISPNLRKLN